MRLGLLLVLLSLLGCSEKASVAKNPKEKSNLQTKLSDLNWMLGKWKREDTGELALWSKREDSYFGGMMVTVNEKEKAVIQEVLALEGRQDGIYFSSKEKGQTNNRRNEFKMSNSNFDAPQFTNSNTGALHQISYMRIGSDKIKVEEMESGGGENSYYFVREI